jgi:hypothetical protein
MTDAKMAEDGVTRNIEAAINKIVNTTDQSGNMRKELKKTIYEAESNLRNIFAKLRVQLEEAKSEKDRLESELKEAKIIQNKCRKDSTEADKNRQLETSRDRGRESPTSSGGQVLPPHKYEPKLYSDIVAGRGGKEYVLTLRTKGNQTPEEIIKVLKEKVNLADFKIRITSLRTLRDGRVSIEAGSEAEIKLLGDKIRKVCAETLIANTQKLRKPRMIILNFPTEITTENILESMTRQNSELVTGEENILPKFGFTTKRGSRNIVIEVNSEARKNSYTIR